MSKKQNRQREVFKSLTSGGSVNFENIRDFDVVYQTLSALAISRFKWKNLPTEITSRNIEKGLYWYGKLAFTQHQFIEYDKQTRQRFIFDKFVALPFTQTSFDIYGEPNSLQYYSYNGRVNGNVSASNAVIIRNNFIERNVFNLIQNYACRISEVNRTLDVRLWHQRTPSIWKTSKDQEFTVKNIFKRANGFEPVIIADKDGFSLEGATIMENKVEFNSTELIAYRQFLLDDFLQIFGINNPVEKKERRISNEMEAENRTALHMLNSMYIARKEACELINERYPELAIDVEYNAVDASLVEGVNNLANAPWLPRQSVQYAVD